MATTTTTHPDPWVMAPRERGMLIGIVATAAFCFVCGMTVADPDLWGHTLYGLRSLDQNVLTESVDPFSYTAPGSVWINHEWLTEYQFGWLWQTCGGIGLWMWRNLMAMGLCAVIAAAFLRSRCSVAAATPLLFFGAVSLSEFFVFIRPQLATFVLFALTLFLLRKYWDKPRWQTIILLPLLTAVWVNLHGGFLAGLGLQAFFVGGFALRTLRDRSELQSLLLLSSIALASVAATLLNPYGLELHRMLWDHLFTDQVVREWQPLWAVRQSPTYYLPFLLLALALPWSRRWAWIDLAVLLIVSYEAVVHVRHLALLSITILVLLPGSLSDSLAKLFSHLARRLERDHRWGLRLTGAVGVAAVLVGLQIQNTWAMWQNGIRPWEIAVESSRDLPGVPVKAIAVMRQEGIFGNLLTDYGWGQYVLWHTYPESRIAFDGRYRTVYPLPLELDFVAFQRAGIDRPLQTPLLDEYPTEIALLPSHRGPRDYLDSRPDWVQIYADSQATLYVRDLPKFRLAIERSRQGRIAAPHIPVWRSFPAGPSDDGETILLSARNVHREASSTP
jgi:hypothetical protein